MICVAILALAPTVGQAQAVAVPETRQSSAKPAESGTCQSIDSENQQLLAAALLHSYATSVNALLLSLASQLHAISQHAAAGELPQQKALALKFAATRATITRLETLSAVYDSQVLLRADGDSKFDDSAPGTLWGKRTVSVQELQHERAK